MAHTQYFRNISKTQGGSVLTVDIHDVDLSVVNAIRRIILSEIPMVALAFDPLADANPSIDIHINHSALHNEFLAHRLSLIPMHFPADIVSDFDSDEYQFRLKVKNSSTEMMPVTSKDIRIYKPTGEAYDDAFHKKVFPPSPITKDYVLITMLRPNLYTPEKGEEIDITFRASKDIAKTHSRWCPVSCCTFFNIVDEEAAAKGLQDKLKEEQRVKERALTSDEENAIKKRFESLHRFRYFHTNEYGEARTFHFKVESECGLKPEYLVSSAFQILHDKIIAFAERCNERHASIQSRKINDTMHELVIENEDFTLLNVIQCIVYHNEVRKKGPKATLQYIGYHQPHPLDNKMVLKLKFTENDVEPLKYLHDVLTKSVASYVQQIKEQWP